MRRSAALAAILLAASAAAVDVFSPGELAKPHAALEGLGQCTKCHPAGQQLARARCTSCHEDVGGRIERNAGYHGRLPEGERDCWRCHHDHLGRDFALVDWGKGGKDGFDHEKAGWPLLGKHRKAKCEKCHDPKYVKEPKVLEAIAKGRRTYLAAPAACDATCHKDPHESRLGPKCDACHTADAWNVLVPAAREAQAQQELHDRTRYPLRQAHVKVPCKACHGPEPGEQAKWRGIPFAACADCHPDAHVGQLAEPRCDRCHGLDAFLPSRYGAEEHAKARYPLEGAHRAVACSRCHPKDPRVEARVPAETVAALARLERKPRFAKALLAVQGDLARCETCHADAHAGQLAPRACTACHEVASWSKLRFDHAKDSRYPLEAKHAKARCASCHRPEPPAGVVRWKPLPLSCEGCHQDPHAGTLAVRAEGKPDEQRCDRCHGVQSWKETKLRHEPPFTEYRLEGKHAKVACDKCHPAAPNVAGLPARRYRGVPASCAACHEDPHKGALRAFAPEPPPGTLAAAVAAGETRCEGCHSTETWEPKPFLHHDRTGFPLEGAHRLAACRACHGEDLAAALPRGCVGCHRDPHAGRLGARCDPCHDPKLGWRASFDVDAHRRTDFPLEGRHALLPCEECHGDRLAPGFARPTPECVACHEDDRLRTVGGPLDHVANAFPTRCQGCHSTWDFVGAALPQHEACFGISSGNHAGISCFGCHVQASVPPQWSAWADWDCAPKTSRCRNCHESENPDRPSPFGRRR